MQCILFSDMKLLTNAYIFAIITGVFMLFLFSCHDNTIYNEQVEIPSDSWHKDSLAAFRFTIDDNSVPYSIILDIENNNQYPRSNIWFFITTVSPEGKSLRDTFECSLAEASGKWLGSKSPDGWENHIYYKQHVGFPQTGTYHISLQQAMRMDKLPGVESVGITIKKENEP